MKTRTTVKKKIFLIMMVLIMLCSAGNVVHQWRENRKESVEDLKERLLLSAEGNASYLNDTIHNVEQSVKTMAVYAQAKLDSADKLGKDEKFREEYTEQMQELFELIAEKTDGAVAIYIRFNPDIAPATSGFFCQRETEDGKFTSLSPTPISDYERDDVGHVGWYWIPVEKKTATWLDPYYNENIGFRMISYCIPYYIDNTLVGVVGMDVRYSELEDAVSSMDSSFDGYTTIISELGTVLIHPELEESSNASRMGEDLRHTGELIAETTGSSGIVIDTFDKTERVVGYARLDNDSILTLVANNTFKEANVDSNLFRTIIVTLVVATVLLAVLWGLLMGFVNPFDQLTDAVISAGEKREAQELPKLQGEAAIVSAYVNKLVEENQQLSEELNQTVYTDHLTKCQNASAWQTRLAELTKKGQDAIVLALFAVDGLQMANVTFDRSKGDYLIITTASRLQAVFGAKQVYRVTGSQFAVILEGETMQSMLLKTGQFHRLCEQQNAQMAEDWHRVTATMVVKGFEADKDKSAADVYKRADYELAEKMGGLDK